MKEEIKGEKEYQENIKLWKKAYKEILDVCEKYPNFSRFSFYDIDDMRNSAKDHLLLVDWYEKYGLKLDHSSSQPYTRNFVDVDRHINIHYYEDAKRGRSIFWSDDERQPLNEWLLVISFPTGAYIFRDGYEGQKDLFQDLFNELKNYKPDYSDTTNKKLYWKLENAKNIFNDFNGILKKYYEKNRSEFNKRMAKKLRDELEKLKKQ